MFKNNEILSEAEIIGKHLRDIRVEKKLELKQIENKINIKYQYLKAIEDGKIEELPSGVYRKSFLKEYACFLGIDFNKELKSFFSIIEEQNNVKNKKRKDLFQNQKIKKHNFIIMPKVIKGVFLFLAIIICFFYLWIGLRKLVFPPNLEIMQPQDNITIEENEINIIGKTDPEAQVVINEEGVSDNEDGFFSKKINLKTGLNIITIVSKKKYGREVIIQRKILVKNNQ